MCESNKVPIGWMTSSEKKSNPNCHQEVSEISFPVGVQSDVVKRFPMWRQLRRYCEISSQIYFLNKSVIKKMPSSSSEWWHTSTVSSKSSVRLSDDWRGMYTILGGSRGHQESPGSIDKAERGYYSYLVWHFKRRGSLRNIEIRSDNQPYSKQ